MNKEPTHFCLKISNSYVIYVDWHDRFILGINGPYECSMAHVSLVILGPLYSFLGYNIEDPLKLIKL